jgi:hypothetical protein
MLTRYCPNCGTEVDETAIFCPTCGQPIDEAAETQMPAAPAWPEPAPRDEAVAPPPVEPEAPTLPVPAVEPDPPVEPDRVAPAPRTDDVAPTWRTEAVPDSEPAAPVEPVPPASPPPPAGSSPREAASDARKGGAPPAVRITMPVTLSGWLIGGGAVVAAIGALIGITRGFVNPVEFLMLLAVVGIAVSVFAAASLPAFAHLRLATLAVALIGFGMGLDRIGFGRANAGDLLFFLGTAAAAIGAILVELGQDQPLGGPQA